MSTVAAPGNSNKIFILFCQYADDSPGFILATIIGETNSANIGNFPDSISESNLFKNNFDITGNNGFFVYVIAQCCSITFLSLRAPIYPLRNILAKVTHSYMVYLKYLLHLLSI